MQWPWWMSIQYFYSFTVLIQTVDWWSEIDLGRISCNVTFFLFCYSFSCVFFKTPTFNPFTNVLTAIKIFGKIGVEECCWSENILEMRILYLEVLDILFYIRSDVFWLSMNILIWTDWTQSKNTLSYTLFVPKLSSAPVMLIIS